MLVRIFYLFKRSILISSLMLVEMVQILFTKPYSLQYFDFLLFRNECEPCTVVYMDSVAIFFLWWVIHQYLQYYQTLIFCTSVQVIPFVLSSKKRSIVARCCEVPKAISDHKSSMDIEILLIYTSITYMNITLCSIQLSKYHAQ